MLWIVVSFLCGLCVAWDYQVEEIKEGLINNVLQRQVPGGIPNCIDIRALHEYLERTPYHAERIRQYRINGVDVLVPSSSSAPCFTDSTLATLDPLRTSSADPSNICSYMVPSSVLLGRVYHELALKEKEKNVDPWIDGVTILAILSYWSAGLPAEDKGAWDGRLNLKAPIDEVQRLLSSDSEQYETNRPLLQCLPMMHSYTARYPTITRDHLDIFRKSSIDPSTLVQTFHTPQICAKLAIFHLNHWNAVKLDNEHPTKNVNWEYCWNIGTSSFISGHPSDYSRCFALSLKRICGMSAHCCSESMHLACLADVNDPACDLSDIPRPLSLFSRLIGTFIGSSDDLLEYYTNSDQDF